MFSLSFLDNFLFISVVFLQITRSNKENSYTSLATTFPIISIAKKPIKFEPINAKEESDNIYKSGELIIDDSKKEVTVDGKNIKVTPTEYNILKFLTKNKGKVFSISQIYENVWEEESYGAENIIAVHIRHIREKIEINPREPKYLKVIWGIGYKIENI